MATGALVITIFGASGAAGVPAPSADSRAQDLAVRVTAPDNTLGANRSARPQACPTARGAVRFYSRRIQFWRDKMGAAHSVKVPAALRTGCPRYLAHVLQRKAYGLRREHVRWHAYQYDWTSWLPDKWQRIGACETGYGRRPGNWRHSNSSYEGAFGFAKSSWDAFKYRADRKAGPYPSDAWQATPRQQYEVALAIYRRYGFSGWGCRGA